MCAHKCWISVSWPVGLSDTRKKQNANFPYIFVSVVPKTQHADLSLVSTQSGLPVSPRRVPGRLLMHSTTSTHIWVCTQTHTEGRLQYASEPPSRHPNAKSLAHKYGAKCINTCTMTCSHFSCIFHRNPPMFTHSLTINKPGVSGCTCVHIRLIVYLLGCMGKQSSQHHLQYNILLLWLSQCWLFIIPHALFTPGQIPAPVRSGPGPLYFVRCCWPCRWEATARGYYRYGLWNGKKLCL